MLRKKLLVLFSFFAINTFTSAQTNQKTAVASKGEGVYSLLRKNNLEPTVYYKEFIKLNESRLKTNNQLVKGKTYLLPLIKKDSTNNKSAIENTKKLINDNHIKEPLLGKKHSSILVENRKLEKAVYYLISGHGGPDPGAIEKYNGKLISEDEYAYDVTLRLAKKLLSNGATVYIIVKDLNDGIRDDQILELDYDEVCYPNNKMSLNQKLRLKQRTKAVNDLYLKHKGAYQRLIVTHIDSRSKSENIDVFFYHHNHSKNGEKLAKNIHNTFKAKYTKYQPNRVYSGSVSSRSLYLIKNTLPAMVYIELGNIKNKKDQKRILNYENREALAKWIHIGLLKDFQDSKNNF